QVIPVLDVLRVALADQERHGRIVGRAGIGQTVTPVFRDQVAALVEDVYVGHLVVGHHIGPQALNDGLSLTGGASMGLLDLDSLAGFFLPFLNEKFVVGGKQFARDVIRGIEQLLVGSLGMSH